MMRHRLILTTLLSHWRRKPWQFVILLIGLATATALWSGVQAINAQARDSYAQAAGVLGGDDLDRWTGNAGLSISLTDYVALRRAGINLSPVMETVLRDGNRRLRIIGIEPTSLPQKSLIQSTDEAGSLADFVTGSGIALVSADTALPLPAILPPARVSDGLPPDTIVVDISWVADRSGRVAPDYLVSLKLSNADHLAISSVTEGRVKLQASDASGDLSRLTDSFHLNLTAFGFLSFVVGLFIVHATIGLSFEQRKPMLRTMRACGASSRALVIALSLEVLGSVLLAGSAGMVLGYLIASSLLPDVAASLRGLYGANVDGALNLQPSWWIAGLGMSLIGAFAAAAQSIWKAARLPVLAPARPEAWQAAHRRDLTRQGGLAILLLGVAVVTLLLGRGLASGFILMGSVLTGTALLLPVLASNILHWMEARQATPLSRWIWADTRQQLRGLTLSLMALLLALSVNIGVGTMVDGFRKTFLGWLDQRLAAELYVTAPDTATGLGLKAFAGSLPEVDAVLPIWSSDVRIDAWPVTVFGFEDHVTYRDNWPMLQTSRGMWDKVRDGQFALVSEQFARRFNVEPGDPLTLPSPSGGWTAEIAGVFSDYGNPTGAVMINATTLTENWSDLDQRRFALRVAPECITTVRDLLIKEGLPERSIVDQSRVKAASREIFETTFAVTLALNALTLVVAGIALFTSLLTLSNLRLPQLAPLWALGMTRRQLGWIELGRMLGLALFTALFAIPLGLILATILTKVINVEAFGWELPVFLFPLQWISLIGLALLTALVASLWPILRLQRTPPATLIGVFSNER